MYCRYRPIVFVTCHACSLALCQPPVRTVGPDLKPETQALFQSLLNHWRPTEPDTWPATTRFHAVKSAPVSSASITRPEFDASTKWEIAFEPLPVVIFSSPQDALDLPVESDASEPRSSAVTWHFVPGARVDRSQLWLAGPGCSVIGAGILKRLDAVSSIGRALSRDATPAEQARIEAALRVDHKDGAQLVAKVHTRADESGMLAVHVQYPQSPGASASWVAYPLLDANGPARGGRPAPYTIDNQSIFEIPIRLPVNHPQHDNVQVVCRLPVPAEFEGACWNEAVALDDWFAKQDPPIAWIEIHNAENYPRIEYWIHSGHIPPAVPLETVALVAVFDGIKAADAKELRQRLFRPAASE